MKKIIAVLLSGLFASAAFAAAPAVEKAPVAPVKADKMAPAAEKAATPAAPAAEKAAPAENAPVRK